MSKSNTFENDLLKLIFNNDDIALIGDAAGLHGRVRYRYRTQAGNAAGD